RLLLRPPQSTRDLTMAPMKTDLEAVIQEVRSAASHLRGADAESWATRLDRDHDRIEQALDWLLKNDPTSGLELALALPDYWHLRGRWAEGRDWLERFLTAISAPTPTLRCRAVSSISGLAFRLGENEKARQFGNEALEIARRLGDKQPRGGRAAIRQHRRRSSPVAGVLRPRPSNRKPLPAAVPRRRAGRSGCRQRRLEPGGPSPGRGKWTLQDQRGRNGSS